MMNLRSEQLIAQLNQKVLVIDGAMGTALQSKNLSTQDFGGLNREGCHESLVLTRPDLIQTIHESYLSAGCDVVETNTFCATPLVLQEFGLAAQTVEINRRAAQIARAAAAQYTTPHHPRFVAGVLGPTTQTLSLTGGITFDTLQENYYTQAKGLLEGEVDYFLLETCQDTCAVKAGILAFERLFAEVGYRIPIAVSATIEPSGTLLAGQSIEALYASLAHLELLYLGLNCATGPEFMTESLRSLARISSFRIACVPNAGLPDENGRYLETPEIFANVLAQFIDHRWLNLVGGCCGTQPAHIRNLTFLAEQGKPRIPTDLKTSYLSGMDALEIKNVPPTILIDSRTHTLKNLRFKTLIEEEKFDEASDWAQSQAQSETSLLALCLTHPERDELQDMKKFLSVGMKKIRVPWLIESTQLPVIELVLTYCQGKSLIYSPRAHMSEDSLQSVTLLARKYGAALGVNAQEDEELGHGHKTPSFPKFGLFGFFFRKLTQEYGVLPKDIYWDLSTSPKGAQAALEKIRWIKDHFPQTHTFLRLSDISHGFPRAGQEVLERIFLNHCSEAGLDLVILDSRLFESPPLISAVEKEYAENLLLHKVVKGRDPVSEFISHFKKTKKSPQKNSSSLPLLERLPRFVIEGSKAGLMDDLKEALKSLKPLEIINGPLMQGMDEVGRLFKKHQLIVAEVLQSSEVMKTAVNYLESFMDKTETATRGTILLATVQGDVHDIGKNLVEIILSNNGFKVVDLGLKVPPEQLIQAVREHRPDIVGLSGLLVKSAHQMVVTAEDFAKAGVTTPILVGGAALSSTFVDKQIAKAYSTGTVAYAQDVMNGLELAKTMVDPQRFQKLKEELGSRRAQQNSGAAPPLPAYSSIETQRSPTITQLTECPIPPDLERHVLRNTPIDQIWYFINPLMLYGRHLGIRGSTVRLLEQGAFDEVRQKDPKAFKIWQTVQEVKDDYRNTPILQPAGIYRYFRAQSEGNLLRIYSSDPFSGESRQGLSVSTTSPPTEAPLCIFDFPRQRKKDGLCLTDYVRSRDFKDSSSSSAIQDHLAFFVVTVGKGVRQLSENLKNQGNYLKSHIIQALALESAEAYAEMLHSQIRKGWGFPDSPDMTLLDRFQAKYRGKRYSFGYPACPRLDDQSFLWSLLRPEEIGIQLTDGFMMDPEASVSAIVFHHPMATYFSVGHQIGGANEDNR